MIAARAFAFQWPSMLLLLIVVPLLVALYLRLLSRRSEASRRYAGLVSSPQAESDGASAASGLRAAGRTWLRHAPAIFMLAGLTVMIIAVARPQAIILLPSRLDAIMLVMDTSGSMRATDIKPNRLAAAQTAARTFIDQQPGQVRVGIVSAAATASVVQSPTENRSDIAKAIDRMQPQPGTALGSGLVMALTTLLPESGIDVEKIITGTSSRRSAWTRDWARQAEIDNFKPVPPGSNGSTAVVLLTDGQSNTGPELEEAAKLAAERGVRVYTVGVGTPEGITLSAEGWSMRVRLDEGILKKVATMTHGEYFRAGNAEDLKKIYQRLSARLVMGKGRTIELSAAFIALGALLALAGALVSMLRSNRIL
jgi:Ca-activated chloride channel family protein